MIVKKYVFLAFAVVTTFVLFQNCSNSTKFGTSNIEQQSNAEGESKQPIQPLIEEPTVLPRDCSSASTSWTVGSSTCTVVYPDMAHRNEKYILTDSSGSVTGQLAVLCNDGRVTEIVGDIKTCVTAAPNPPAPPTSPPITPPTTPPTTPACVPTLIGCGNDYRQVAVWPGQNAWYSGVQPENNSICGTSTYNPSLCFRADHTCAFTSTPETQNDPRLGSYVIRNDTIFESSKIYSTCPPN